LEGIGSNHSPLARVFSMLIRYFFLLGIFSSSFLCGNEDYKKIGKIPTRSPFSLASSSKFLPYNPIIIEIGAGVGGKTKELTRLRKKGVIYSFEPNQESFQKLQKTTENLKNVHIFPFGISKESGFYSLYQPVSSLQGKRLNDCLAFSSLLVPSQLSKSLYKYEISKVECTNLEKWCQEQGLREIDMLYLDACGYEAGILCSSMNIIRTAKIIFVTTYDQILWERQASFNAINKILENAEFTLLSYWHKNNEKGMALYVKTDYYKGIFERKFL
jgi:FkbM family methyltransferase